MRTVVKGAGLEPAPRRRIRAFPQPTWMPLDCEVARTQWTRRRRPLRSLPLSQRLAVAQRAGGGSNPVPSHRDDECARTNRRKTFDRWGLTPGHRMYSALYQLSYEVTPAYAPRIEPPRGLEPRPPHYERGVLPVELWRQGVRTVGIEPTTPGWKPGMFPLHHVHVERASTRSEAGTAVSSFERPQS